MAGRARKGKNEGKGKITNFPFSLYKYSERDKIILVQEMGARLMAGQQTLNLYVEVRLLCAQPVKSSDSSEGFLFALNRTNGHSRSLPQGVRALPSGFSVILLRFNVIIDRPDRIADPDRNIQLFTASGDHLLTDRFR